ncbi:MAG TPA: hypothetical protein DD637_04875 [Verrucomicrobia bacterium]|nr:hypothetical protein [Verrucomicrobiota bacterium]HCG20365.1 hypothetical protein [Verrucomicrobiota bacterium]
MFDIHSFKRLSCPDVAYLRTRLAGAEHMTCELSPLNLYVWGYTSETVWQECNGHLYFHLRKEDMLLFADFGADARTPGPSELAEASAALRAAGYGGKIWQVRPAYLDAHPQTAEFFVPRLEDDAAAEYVYETAALRDLTGEKLRKKRNLIKQFLKAHPEPVVKDVADGPVLEDCLALAAEWRARQENPGTEALVREADALGHLRDGFAALGCEGVAVYTEEGLAAFCVYDRVNAEVFTESFEKSRFGVKGAAQFANHEMAKRLSGRARYINREQDLGSEGLRHAKLSYDPAFLLKNDILVPRV